MAAQVSGCLGTGVWGRVLIYWHDSFQQLESLFFDNLFAPFYRLAGCRLRNAKPFGKLQGADAKSPGGPVA